MAQFRTGTTERAPGRLWRVRRMARPHADPMQDPGRAKLVHQRARTSVAVLLARLWLRARRAAGGG